MTSANTIALNTTNQISTEPKPVEKNSSWHGRDVVIKDSQSQELTSIVTEIQLPSSSNSSLSLKITKPANFEEEIALFRKALPPALHTVACSYLDPTSEIFCLVKSNIEIPEYLKKLAENVVDLDLSDPALNHLQVFKLLDCFKNIRSLKLPRHQTQHDPHSDKYMPFRSSLPDVSTGFELQSSFTAIKNSILTISALKNLEDLDMSHWLSKEVEQQFPNMYELISSGEKLRRLNISDSFISNDQLACIIASCKDLEYLNLNNCTRLSNSGLSVIKNLFLLKTIELEGCRFITNDGIHNISELSTLEHLNIGGLNAVSNCEIHSNLKSLNVSSCNIAEEGLRSIANFTDLTHLNMQKCLRIDDSVIRHIVQCIKLQHLNISSCPISNEGLSYIGQLNELEHLDISGISITEGGLEHLYSLKNLKTLNVYWISFTRKEMDNIREKMPWVTINCGRDPNDIYYNYTSAPTQVLSTYRMFFD